MNSLQYSEPGKECTTIYFKLKPAIVKHFETRSIFLEENSKEAPSLKKLGKHAGKIKKTPISIDCFVQTYQKKYSKNKIRHISVLRGYQKSNKVI